MSILSKRGFDLFLLFLGCLLTIPLCYSHFIDGDVIQMLDRAHLFVTQGVLTPYGNLSASGSSGNVPGAFLTLATGLPMLLWPSPWSALVLIGLLHLIGYFCYRRVLQDFIRPEQMVLVTLLFWLNPWRLTEVFLWNPGYLYFVACVHFWSAYHLSKKPSFWMSVLHGLSIFTALQIHVTVAILIFITLFLLWSGAMKPNWWGALASIVLGVMSLIPYIQAGLADPSIFPQPGTGEGKGFLFFGLVMVYPMLKGFWYWILFGSNIFQTHAFHQVNFTWAGDGLLSQGLSVSWTGIKYLIGAFGVGLSFYVNYQFFKRYRDKLRLWKFGSAQEGNWLVTYTGAAFLSAMIATAIAPTLTIYWHLLMIWPFTIVPLILFLSEKWRSPSTVKRVSQYLVILIFYFGFTNLFVGLGSKKHDIRQSFHDLYLKACQERCSEKLLVK